MLSQVYLLLKFAESIYFNKQTYFHLEPSDFLLSPGKPSALTRKVKHSRNTILKHLVRFFKGDSFY